MLYYVILSYYNPRPINEDEIKHLKDHQYTAISDQQILIDQKIQAEVRVSFMCWFLLLVYRAVHSVV